MRRDRGVGVLVTGLLSVLTPLVTGALGLRSVWFLYVGPLPLLLFLVGPVGIVYGVATLHRETTPPLTPRNALPAPVLTAVLLLGHYGTVEPPQLGGGTPPEQTTPTLELLFSGLGGQAIGAALLVVGVAVSRKRPAWAAGAGAVAVGLGLTAGSSPLWSLALTCAAGAPLVAIGWYAATE
jgi:hypothetical protein